MAGIGARERGGREEGFDLLAGGLVGVDPGGNGTRGVGIGIRVGGGGIGGEERSALLHFRHGGDWRQRSERVATAVVGARRGEGGESGGCQDG